MIRKAIFDVLNADHNVTGKLATYRSIPALFTLRVIPKDSGYPACIIDKPVGASPFGTRSSRGGEFLCSVRVYDNKKQSSVALAAAAQAVWESINRAALIVTGYTEYGCWADPPVGVDDEEGFPGYLVQVRVQILEN